MLSSCVPISSDELFIFLLSSILRRNIGEFFFLRKDNENMIPTSFVCFVYNTLVK
jgi:hypothetical protein